MLFHYSCGISEAERREEEQELCGVRQRNRSIPLAR
jgi:hypothetical protein